MVIKRMPDIIKQISRILRQNMTDVELILWEKLRTKRLLWKKFLRQYPVYIYTENTWYERFIIPDFICKEEKLIIELDGNIHNEKDIYLLDREKEKLLIEQWYKILRFKNEEVSNNLGTVLKQIAASFS